MTEAAGERAQIAGAALPEEAGFEERLRPRSLDEMVGQDRLRENLKVFVRAARERAETLDHMLFHGPPGLGKTSLAHVVAHERAAPLRDRFGWVARLEYYPPADLERILQRSARVLGVALGADACAELSGSSRGTPRVANRLLRRVRDFAEVDGGPGTLVDGARARFALERLEVDASGFDRLDLTLLRTLLEKFDGGPVGLETLAAAVGEDKGTLEDVVEPFLIHEGFLARTPRGRVATRLSREYFGLAPLAPPSQPKLL